MSAAPTRESAAGSCPAAGLADLLHPLPVKDFHASVRGRQVLHQPGTPGRFAALFGWDLLNEVLETRALEPPRLKLALENERFDGERFLFDSDIGVRRIDAGAMTAMVARGASVILSLIDELVPHLGRLADAIGAELNCRTNINSYFAARARPGFDLHWDHHDVIVLQVAGCKRWRVFPPTRENPLRGEEAPRPDPDSAECLLDTVLEDGDVLYVPRGFWHIATPLEGPSLHLTIALTPPTGSEYLAWLGRPVPDDPSVRADLPVHLPLPELARHAAAIGSGLDGAGAEEAMALFLAEVAQARPARPHFAFPALQAGGRAEIGDDTGLRLASSRRIAVRFETERARFSVAGIEHDSSIAAGKAISSLSGDRETPFGALAAGLDPSARSELQRLLALMVAGGAVFAGASR